MANKKKGDGNNVERGLLCFESWLNTHRRDGAGLEIPEERRDAFLKAEAERVAVVGTAVIFERTLDRRHFTKCPLGEIKRGTHASVIRVNKKTITLEVYVVGGGVCVRLKKEAVCFLREDTIPLDE